MIHNFNSIWRKDKQTKTSLPLRLNIAPQKQRYRIDIIIIIGCTKHCNWNKAQIKNEILKKVKENIKIKLTKITKAANKIQINPVIIQKAQKHQIFI